MLIYKEQLQRTSPKSTDLRIQTEFVTSSTWLGQRRDQQPCSVGWRQVGTGISYCCQLDTLLAIFKLDLISSFQQSFPGKQYRVDSAQTGTEDEKSGHRATEQERHQVRLASHARTPGAVIALSVFGCL